MKKILRDLLKQKRGMIGIEAAIVLISFVIVAAAFSFMVVNMGLFATSRGKETIQQGVSESTSPLVIDGSIHIRGTTSATTLSTVDAMVIPLKTIGQRYVPMAQYATEVLVRVENHTAIADCFTGIAPDNSTDNPYTNSLDSLVTATQAQAGIGTLCRLFIGNSNNNTSLDYNEKGYLVFYLNGSDVAAQREHIYVEIRPEAGAPISVEFVVPPQLNQGWTTIGS